MDPAVKKYSQIMDGQPRYKTEFKWELRDWHLLYEVKYSKGVTSDNFELEGSNGCLCQIFLNPLDPNCHLTLMYSDLSSILALGVNIKINEEFTGRYSWKRSLLKTQRLVSSIPNNMKVKTRDELANESLTICANFEIAGSPKASIRQNPPENILKNIKVLFDNGALCDITFVLGDKELAAHKAIVAAQSKVFQAMFLNEMTEKEKGTVNISDTRAEVFQKFLDYLYTGETKDFEEMVDELIVVADKYQVNTLKTICKNYMMQNVCATNAVKYLIVADKLRCTELKEKALEIFKNSASASTKVIEEGDEQVSLCLKKLLIDSSEK